MKDVRDIRIVSLIPPALSRDRETLGHLIGKLLFLVVSQRLGEAGAVLFREASAVPDLDEFFAAAIERAREVAAQAESVIVDQVAEVGLARMMTSKVVSRCLWIWEQRSVDTVERLMRAEVLAAQRFQGLRPAPLNDPLNSPAKEALVRELRSLRPRLQNQHGTKRSHADLIFQFRDAVNSGLFPLLSVTLESWVSFFSLQQQQNELRAFATKGRIGYSNVVDSWFARYKGHSVPYTRQMLSTRAS